MKRVFALILITVMLLTLAACGKAVENNASQNELSGTPQIETTPDAGSAPDNDSSTDVPT